MFLLATLRYWNIYKWVLFIALFDCQRVHPSNILKNIPWKTSINPIHIPLSHYKIPSNHYNDPIKGHYIRLYPFTTHYFHWIFPMFNGWLSKWIPCFTRETFLRKPPKTHVFCPGSMASAPTVSFPFIKPPLSTSLGAAVFRSPWVLSCNSVPFNQFVLLGYSFLIYIYIYI